jgi:phenylpyruvate tautomerase PptA (4-oxalocrotonate tautomerase family)
MPMIDAVIPEGALKPEAEERLLSELTDILLKHEGFDPANQRARNVTVTFLHRPAAVYVAGVRSPLPRYRIVPTVPEGQYTDAARQGLVRDVTEAVVRAEGGKFEEVSPRVWVFPTEVPDGRWGSRGAIQPITNIMAYILGVDERKAEEARKEGEARLIRSRRQSAAELLGTALKDTAK